MGGTVPVEAILPLTGAVNAAILATVISLRSSVRSAVLFYASTLLSIVAAVIFVIVADHAGLAEGPALAGAERALTVLCGPVFLLFVAASLRRSWDWRVIGAPAATLWAADQVAAFAFDAPLSFWLIVAAQTAYTLSALLLALASRSDGLRSGERRWRLVMTVIGLMLLVHVSQAIRFVAPDVLSLQNIVPNVAGASVLLLALPVFFSARLPTVDLLAAARVEQGANDLAQVVARLDNVVVAGGLGRNADLKVGDAAAAAGVSARDLAHALAEARGTTFPEYLAKTRVDRALKLLCDPNEQRTSMEAIGLLSGFGSRSAFYSAFAKHVGATPSAYRRRLAENSCPNS